MKKLYVNDEGIKKGLEDLGLAFHEKPGECKEADTLAAVVKYLSTEGRQDYTAVLRVIEALSKSHIPVVVLDEEYNPRHASEVWRKPNVVRYLPLDDPGTCDEVRRFLIERLRRQERADHLTDKEIHEVGWSVRVEEGLHEEASLVSLFVGSMGRFMVELKTLLDLLRDEARRALEQEGALKPAAFGKLDLQKVMEFRQALNQGKEKYTFRDKEYKEKDMEDDLEDTKASVLFKAPRTNARNGIIVEGETGSGKSLIARFIHDYVFQDLGQGDRAKLEKVNCANLGEKILETQLFGSMAGAYTDARTRPGAILNAYHGTVFLDEVGELTPELQAKLLSYLDTQTICPDGWYGDPIHVPSLLVAATNRRLAEEVERGTFRRDLHHRLGYTVTIPPLRERLKDLDRLVDFVLQNPMVNPWWNKSKKPGDRAVNGISKTALEILRHHAFPGNFRELEQVLRRACVKAQTQGVRIITEDILALQGLHGEYCP